MKEIAYRSIFPNNNIPLMESNFKGQTLKETLSKEITFLINNVDFTAIAEKISKLEFKVEEKKDPVRNLLNILKEKNL